MFSTLQSCHDFDGDKHKGTKGRCIRLYYAHKQAPTFLCRCRVLSCWWAGLTEGKVQKYGREADNCGALAREVAFVAASFH
jgi:hypothetical protein